MNLVERKRIFLWKEGGGAYLADKKMGINEIINNSIISERSNG